LKLLKARLWLFGFNQKTSLDKMMIKGQCCRNTSLSHNHKRDTVS